MNITGRTRFIAHLGWPTESFRAPLIYNPWFEKSGVDCVVVPVGCRAPAYPTMLRALFTAENIVGALVTMPHKVATLSLVDEASTAAQVAGACNAVRRLLDGRLHGDLFDGAGFVRGLDRKGVVVRGASALVVGCGGVGSAIAASLAEAGLSRLSLFDSQAAGAASLAARLAKHFPALQVQVGSGDPAGHDVVVNATPLGMKPGDPLPIDPSRIEPRATVGEVVMSQDLTPLLRAAQARGCRIQIGSDMLFEQIPAYLDYFGLPPATAEQLRKAARQPGPGAEVTA